MKRKSIGIFLLIIVLAIGISLLLTITDSRKEVAFLNEAKPADEKKPLSIASQANKAVAETTIADDKKIEQAKGESYCSVSANHTLFSPNLAQVIAANHPELNLSAKDVEGLLRIIEKQSQRAASTYFPVNTEGEVLLEGAYQGKSVSELAELAAQENGMAAYTYGFWLIHFSVPADLASRLEQARSAERYLIKAARLGYPQALQILSNAFHGLSDIAWVLSNSSDDATYLEFNNKKRAYQQLLGEFGDENSIFAAEVYRLLTAPMAKRTNKSGLFEPEVSGDRLSEIMALKERRQRDMALQPRDADTERNIEQMKWIIRNGDLVKSSAVISVYCPELENRTSMN
ncbi:hypothetical protein [Permianibacter aggregans]|uniref:Uncharacterized protein n=1 Tax=Permianibacter aggregans TaxID=1510150 RepID=A0A4R6ULZ5_9GAMM|nr:hypothetical protein [Permianibacter aggregans]QGX39100.1 hypothetical protein E2H98_05245 [Permianibacter aggregans]TDQ47692.1 hypothetical protein EV696_10996 [Permianibacter aggregans]